MIDKIVLGIVLSLFFFPLISAADLTFPFNTEYDIKRPCISNGTYCNPNFLCNLTVSYPNGDVMINNQQMTDQNSFRNFTVTQTLNNQLGIHQALMGCTEGSISGANTFTVEITGDGNKSNVFPLQFSVLLLSFALIVIGSLNDRLRLIKHGGAILAIVMGVVTLYPGYSGINYSSITGLGLGTVVIALGFYFLVEDSFSRDKQEDTYEAKSEYVDNDGRFHDD